jgi:hypothetical protein
MPISIPVEAGNKAARTSAFGEPFKKILDAMKPEAASFTVTATGERGGFIVFDMKDTSQNPLNGTVQTDVRRRTSTSLFC